MENTNETVTTEHVDDLSVDTIQLNQSTITHSGNSDVTVQITIQVDVKPIAFAILYSLVASKQLSTEEFESALQKLAEY